jgi:hypothetical protein
MAWPDNQGEELRMCLYQHHKFDQEYKGQFRKYNQQELWLVWPDMMEELRKH